MYFDTLKADYRKHCLDPDFHIENKQRINLSKEAVETILRDFEVLERQNSFAGGKLTSTILNHLFRCYYEEADASVEQSTHRVREKLACSLESMPDTGEKKRALDLMTQTWREHTQKNCMALMKQKGISLNIRIDRNNLEHLVSENCQMEAEFYKNQVGEYIKTILEEYARLPFVRRERIYCKQVCDEIQKALVNQNILKIALHSVCPETGLHNVVYVKPYRILTDSEHLYNYLTGYTLKPGEKEWLPGSVRLSSVLRCEVRLSSSFLSQKQIRVLEHTMEQYGVQYMTSRNMEEEIWVHLTKKGEQRYSRLLHLRPAYKKEAPDSPGTYIFGCSPLQADNYFFAFGAEAEILKPAWLREKFQEKYRAALETYEK